MNSRPRRQHLVGLVCGLGTAACLGPLVPAQNQPPIVSDIAFAPSPVAAGKLASLSVSATDPDSDPMSFAWQVDAGEIQGQGAAVAWQAPLQPGTYELKLTVSDNRPGGVVARTVSIQVVASDGGNSAPVIVSVTANPTAIRAWQTSQVAVDGVDGDGDTLSYTWSTNFGSVSGTGATATYQPPSSCCLTTATVTVVVDDGHGNSTTGTVPIQVSP